MPHAHNPLTVTTKPHAPLWFLGLCCGAGVSTIYLCQPLLPAMGRTFGVNPAAAGLVAVCTQVGYALGLLCFTPLGDILERRRLIRRLFAGVALALFLEAFAPSLGALLLLSAVASALACVTHIVLPIAPDLAEPENRGRAIGVVMTGLLLGVLLARTFSGWVNDIAAHLLPQVASWRIVFVAAAVVSAVLPVLAGRFLPELPPKENLTYAQTMRSLWTVWSEEPTLRESCLVGGLAFGSFCAFWNTLAFMLGTHGFGAGVAGSFGLVGALGALIAVSVGRLSDRRGPRYVLSLALSIMIVAEVGIYATERYAVEAQSGPGLRAWMYLLGLAVMVVMFDVGMQGTQLGNQTRIFALRPAARSRINTLYMVSYFMGGAAASAASAAVWQRYGYAGVSALEIGLACAALLLHLTGRRTAHARVSGDTVAASGA